MGDLLTTLALDQYHQLDSSVQLVVMHPRFRQQRYLMSAFIATPGTLYVRCNSHPKFSKEELMSRVHEELAHQWNDDLSQVQLVILDEYDRAKPKVVDAFIKDVLNFFGDRRVILMGREIPKIVLTNKGIRQCTRIIPEIPSAMMWDYTRYDDEQILLEVHAFGTGRVSINGKAIDNWDGSLPRALFFYLIDRGMATRADIFAMFWPTLSTREATNVFHVTKRKINEVLGMDLTVYWSGFYRIAPEINVQYDVITFSQKVQDADIAGIAEAERLYSEALMLSKGEFLIGMNFPWVERRRSELRQTMTDLLYGLALTYESSGQLEKALSFYLRAASHNRQREDIAAKIMKLYAEIGNPEAGLAAYHALETELRETLRVSPANEIQQLAAMLRSKIAS